MFGFRKSSKGSVRLQEQAPVFVPLDSTERAYASAWGFSDTQWQNMTPEQRRDYRDRVSFASMRVGADK